MRNDEEGGGGADGAEERLRAVGAAARGGLQAEVQRPRHLVREVYETSVSAERWRHLCVAEAEVLRIVRGEREQRAQGQSQGGVG